MICPENGPKRMNFMHFESRLVFLHDITLKNVFFVFSLFSIYKINIKNTVQNLILRLWGKEPDDKHVNLENDDRNDDNTDLQYQNAFICRILRREYSNKPLKAVLNLFKSEEDQPTVDENTKMHDDLIVIRVKLDDLRFRNRSSVPHNDLNSFN